MDPEEMTPKSPHIAAILSLLSGPLGFFYIGWRFAVCGIAALALFVATDWLIGLPIAAPGRYIILPVYAWKAAAIVNVRNRLNPASRSQFHTFPMAILASTDLLIGLAMCFAAAVAVYESYVLIRDGETVPGLAALAVGAPVAIQLVGMLFAIITTPIESRAAAHVPEGGNIFRKGSWSPLKSNATGKKPRSG
ncbi:MAG: hypothetical protein U0R19_32665 [Bryobacteraceae bacterium]